MAACEIERECGLGTGYLAAVGIEIWQNDEVVWDSSDPSMDDSEIRAGQIGANAGEGDECCDKACSSNFPEGAPWNDI